MKGLLSVSDLHVKYPDLAFYDFLYGVYGWSSDLVGNDELGIPGEGIPDRLTIRKSKFAVHIDLGNSACYRCLDLIVWNA